MRFDNHSLPTADVSLFAYPGFKNECISPETSSTWVFEHATTVAYVSEFLKKKNHSDARQWTVKKNSENLNLRP